MNYSDSIAFDISNSVRLNAKMMSRVRFETNFYPNL